MASASEARDAVVARAATGTKVVRDPLHCVVYSDSGAGKSTFAATWPTPMILFAWDPFGKERPYLNRGTPGEYTRDARGTPVRLVRCPKGIIQIEHYIDADPTRPEAYMRFLSRMAEFGHEAGNWQTVVIDSITFMEIAARKMHQYHLNPNTREPRAWFAGSTEALEEMLMIRCGSLPMNVVVVAHVDEDKDELHGMFVRNPAAPGRMRKRLAAGYGELYHARVVRNDDGSRAYELQTRTDTQFQASSQIGAPDPAAPHYAALWNGGGG